MAEITLKGRRIPLLYTTWEMKTIQEEIAPVSKAIRMVMGLNPEDDTDTSWYGSVKHLDACGKMIMILGNAGLEEDGQEPDLTLKNVMRAMKPGVMGEMISQCMEAMNEGMASEIPPEKKDGPVDVVLERIEKKKEKAG